jgi:NAD(P)-dependent dehydrogenase (short-subunit alcohol dehydrogenase family)
MSEESIYRSLAGRSVIVTGGGSGIGEAISHGFGRQGAKVGIIEQNGETGERVADAINSTGGTAFSVAADVTSISQLQAAIAVLRDRHGPTDVLVNNAGSDTRHAFEAITPNYWDDRIAVNLKHMAFAAQFVTEDMRDKGRGVIVNLGSTSWMQGAAGMVAYTTAKSAVAGLTRSLARELGVHGIRVMCVAPGRVVTARTIAQGMTDEWVQQTKGRQCLKELVLPDDIARLILWLSSDDARMVTSQTYVLDGGVV